MSHILVTGAAGFIGYHVADRLLRRGDRVTGIDNLNAYYDVALKRSRLAKLQAHADFSFVHMDLASRAEMESLFREARPEKVVHLGAQAGVRHSIDNPHVYVESNVVGFLNVLEGCRALGVGHLAYASSSSVYGANTKAPFSVHDNVDHPLSLYAASKKANELMAHAYSWLHSLPATGLRFFTVYGPWGRPDMALFLFTKAILEGRPIELFNEGRMQRDFTYVDDIAEGVVRTLDEPPAPNPNWSGLAPDPATSLAPHRLFNIGNNQPVELLRVIEILEERLGRKAVRKLLPMQAGDVPRTFADVDELTRATGFRPGTPIEEGIARFVDWYRDYYRI